MTQGEEEAAAEIGIEDVEATLDRGLKAQNTTAEEKEVAVQDTKAESDTKEMKEVLGMGETLEMVGILEMLGTLERVEILGVEKTPEMPVIAETEVVETAEMVVMMRGTRKSNVPPATTPIIDFLLVKKFATTICPFVLAYCFLPVALGLLLP